MTQLFDNHGRILNYVRIAVTDRCNLRCSYCMPNDIRYLPKSHLLTFEEIERMVAIFAGLGISKVRLTGGEPFMCKGLPDLIERILRVEGISECHITTNGVLTAPYVPILRNLGVTSVNLSLDAFDRQRFHRITGRDDFEKCLAALHLLLEHEIPVKINCVVMDGLNTDDIIPLIELTKDTPVSVRFIEAMPFNGGDFKHDLVWDHRKILSHITSKFSTLTAIKTDPNSTAVTYKIPGYSGTVGIIAGFSRTFCGTCNRIRVTAQGTLKTCLYDNGVFSLRDLLRAGASDSIIEAKLTDAFQQRFRDGREAEQIHSSTSKYYGSMSVIGG
ncbi:MAG TPA: GTP 3',8-cyclase MoaA [Chryseosolibacter sp.]|nr:GTP 3',8-cyclase MoaA [Chryseosolibacter sp.]